MPRRFPYMPGDNPHPEWSCLRTVDISPDTEIAMGEFYTLNEGRLVEADDGFVNGIYQPTQTMPVNSQTVQCLCSPSPVCTQVSAADIKPGDVLEWDRKACKSKASAFSEHTTAPDLRIGVVCKLVPSRDETEKTLTKPDDIVVINLGMLSAEPRKVLDADPCDPNRRRA